MNGEDKDNGKNDYRRSDLKWDHERQDLIDTCRRDVTREVTHYNEGEAAFRTVGRRRTIAHGTILILPSHKLIDLIM